MIPLSTSLDHVGPIGRTVADVAAIFAAIAGYDAADKASVNAPVEDYVAGHWKKVPALRSACRRNSSLKIWTRRWPPRSITRLQAWLRMGAEIRDMEMPVPTDRTLQSAESYAFHAEFVARSPELYQPETLRRIRTGQNVSPDVLLESRRELEQARRDIVSVFADVDVLVTPTTPIAAPAIAELKQNPDLLRPRELLLLRNTRPSTFGGCPRFLFPADSLKQDCPSVCRSSVHTGEKPRVLRVAHAYEQATAWHKREPVSS